MARQTVASGNLPLFRGEALERFRGKAWQPPLLSRPVSVWALATLALIAAAAFVAFAASFEFARKEQVRGYLTPADGWSRVTSKSFGVIRRRLANPGENVRAGDVLLEISPGDGVRQALTVHDRMLEEIEGRREALDERIRLIGRDYEQEIFLLTHAEEAERRELERIEEEIELTEVRARVARQRYLDGLRLADSGALARDETIQLEDDMQARLLVLSERRRGADRLRESLAANAARVAQLRISRDLNTAAIRDQIHALAMEESRIRGEGAHRVLAPRDGTVVSVRVDAGDGVQPGQALLDIVPRGSVLQGRLFVPSAAMGFVEPGQEVRVYLDAFPYERHGAQSGRVSSVSATALTHGEAPAGQVHAGAHYRVDVEFPNGFTLSPTQIQALRPGMTVSADLVRDYGTLVDWIMEPLQGAARRL
ncbi:MAG: HlyD family efflux transporter periplasmic adaptor subunit [Rhodospirillales bacterium]|nr:HlyD family efflux transporter periplasmic adaptor subunit [Rhodospirillales bacterium]